MKYYVVEVREAYREYVAGVYNNREDAVRRLVEVITRKDGFESKSAVIREEGLDLLEAQIANKLATYCFDGSRCFYCTHCCEDCNWKTLKKRSAHDWIETVNLIAGKILEGY